MPIPTDTRELIIVGILMLISAVIAWFIVR